MTKSFNKESPIGEMDRRVNNQGDQHSQAFIDTRHLSDENGFGGPPEGIRLTLTIISDPWNADMWVSQRSLLTSISKYGSNFDDIEFRVGTPETLDDDHVTIDDRLAQLLSPAGKRFARLINNSITPTDMTISARALAAVAETAPHRSLSYFFYLQHAAFLKGLDIEDSELTIRLAAELNIDIEPIIDGIKKSPTAAESIDRHATLPKLIITRQGPDTQITREISGPFTPTDVSTTCKEFGFTDPDPTTFWKYHLYDQETINHILALSVSSIDNSQPNRAPGADGR